MVSAKAIDATLNQAEVYRIHPGTGARITPARALHFPLT
jgi:hypothetical protein